MKVLVTGGAGFIGSHLCDCLIKSGYQVSVIDNLSSGKKSNLSRQVEFFKIDICSVKVKNLVKKIKPDYVCHLAAQINVPESLVNPQTDAEVNIIGSLNILEAVKDLSIKKFLFVSSGGAIYGEAKIIPTPETALVNPMSPYALSKQASERYLQFYSEHYGLPYVIMRPANVYGPRQGAGGEAGVVSIFINKLLHNQDLPIHGTGKQTRDLVYVSDVSQALLAALTRGRGIYNVGTGKETSVRDLAVLLGKVNDSVPKVSYVSARGKGDINRSALNCKLIKQQLGWQSSYDINNGLKQTVDWFKKNNL
ncbi:MAG: NAD-dependent epimerase/dehydratase family protein [Patescibacteria group bacterium]